VNYYRLKEKNDLPNVLTPEFPSPSVIWSENHPLFLLGRVQREKDYLYFLSFYRSNVLSNAFLVAAEVWEIWREFQDGGRCRPCAFGHVSTRQVKAYYLLLPKILDALHEDTVYYWDGNLDTIVLSGKMVGTNQVFVVKGSTQMELLVSEDVLEEMLRNNIVGFEYEYIEMRGDC